MADNKPKKTAILELNMSFEGLNRVEDTYKSFMPMTVPIGSEWVLKDGKTTQEIIRGLTEEEEYFLMSRTLVNCKNTDDNFTKACYDYWADYQIKFPDNTQKLVLNIGYTTKEGEYKGQKVKYNVPDNLSEYIMYNFAKRSSVVAHTKDDKERSFKFNYILSEPEEVKKEKTFSLSIKQAADKHYLELTNGAKVDKYNPSIDYVFQVLKENSYVEVDDLQDKLNWLYEFKDKNPVKFSATVGMKDLAETAEIYKLVEQGILSKVDNYYGFGDIAFGGLESTIAYFKNQNNTVVVNEIRAKALSKKETIAA